MLRGEEGEDDFVLELTYNPPEPEDPGPEEFQWYEPSFFRKLASNRPLVILLIVAFLVLVVGPSLFYLFNPPRPRPPRPVRGQGIPALSEPQAETLTFAPHARGAEVFSPSS